MYSRVLVPLDGSPSSQLAVEEVQNLAPAIKSAQLLLIDKLLVGSVRFEDYTMYADQYAEIRRQSGMDYMRSFIWKLETSGIEVKATVKFGDPVPTIARTTREESFDRIILAGETGGWLMRPPSLADLANRLSKIVEPKIVVLKEKKKAA